MAKLTPAKIVSGDTWERAWIIKDATGAPVNLTGAQARLQVRDSAGVLKIDATTVNAKLLLDPLAGRIDTAIPYTDTELGAGAYRFALQVTHASGLRKTYETNTLQVSEDVTHDS